MANFLLPPPYKLTVFAPIAETTSGKGGVDMSTPVHPITTPLVNKNSKVKDREKNLKLVHKDSFTTRIRTKTSKI